MNPQTVIPEALRAYVQSIDIKALGGAQPAVRWSQPECGCWLLSLQFELAEPAAQDDWQLRITPAFSPDTHWAPHLTPTDAHVISRHAFRAPFLAVTGEPGALYAVPDLDALCAQPRTSWYMDLDAGRNALTLGMGEYEVDEEAHVLYRRAPGARYAGTVTYGVYLLTRPQRADNLWRVPLDFLWRRWSGTRKPESGALSPFVKHAYAWAHERWEKHVWQQFELGGAQVGGHVFIVNTTQSPNYPGAVSEREFRSVWNQAWFCSLRGCAGLYRYGKRNADARLMERARMGKELALRAPQTNGFFPSVLGTRMERATLASGETVRRSLGWETAGWGNSDRNPFTHDYARAPLHVLDMSITALEMLRWYHELERDERLIAYARNYADALLGAQLPGGFFPGWLDEQLRPMGVLDDSPESALSATFLLELFRHTGKTEYRDAALRAVRAVADGPVRDGRWEDFETYWSCSRYGADSLVGRKVERNAQYKQCTLSMAWSAEALLAAYEITGEMSLLSLGQRCLDEMLSYQACWQPPFLPLDVFGGFAVMNGDAEWLDMRQAVFAGLILDYARVLHSEEYELRGAAAMRASFRMMYCPENPEVKTLWEQRWPFFDEKDYGFAMENYGHGGMVVHGPDGIGVFTIFDWGNGLAAAMLLRNAERYERIQKML